MYNRLRLVLIGNPTFTRIAFYPDAAWSRQCVWTKNVVARSWLTVSSTDEVKAMIEAGVECKEVDAIRERETALASSYSKAS